MPTLRRNAAHPLVVDILAVKQNLTVDTAAIYQVVHAVDTT